MLTPKYAQLVLKNSAFWYDKSFVHGISAASGMRFEEPVELRRTTGIVGGEAEGKGVGQLDGWEGLCGTCGVWMTLGGGRRGGVPWFRHAYRVGPWNLEKFERRSCGTDALQCHPHPKVQDTPKRRRASKGERASRTTTSERAAVGGGDDCADGEDMKMV